MAFTLSQLRRNDIFAQISDYSGRPDTTTYIYSYRTTDTAATVETAGYFDTATMQGNQFLQHGDIINAVMVDTVSGSVVYKNYVITAAILYGDAHNTISLQTTTAG